MLVYHVHYREPAWHGRERVCGGANIESKFAVAMERPLFAGHVGVCRDVFFSLFRATIFIPDLDGDEEFPFLFRIFFPN